MQEEAAKHNSQKEEKARYEEIFFRLMDMYRQTLCDVRVGEVTGREVLLKAMGRVDASLIEERVNALPRDMQGRWDSKTLTTIDLQRIDYLHYRNFKIVGAEINPQARLVDTFEVLLGHVARGVPDHSLTDTYKELLFSQITFIECRYFFLVALSHPARARLRDLLAETGFFERISRSQIYKLHRDMYKEYWGQEIGLRELPSSIPMAPARVKRAVKAHKAAGGLAKTTYMLRNVRQLPRKNERGESDVLQ
ncbi:hypothetical protein CEJ42_16910 [Herbaspirillum robiniae]|uniref:Uncharacterized protein n=2 Tax=Herbaspirillum robiniae TaxID=2014887 RepID=A0A246WN34_9BURK|nr:hypothetical protein CEJ42_16910 [Herbaspirillum robiniae]